MYSIDFEPRAAREFKKLPIQVQKAIAPAIDFLVLNPFSRTLDIKKLENPFPGYRLRVGDYRVSYIVDTNTKHIVVYRIRHRKDAYK